MTHKGKHHRVTDAARLLCCPECVAVLQTKLLELKDEDQDEPEMLLLLDCPKGHVHATLTPQDIVAAVSAEVLKRLRF